MVHACLLWCKQEVLVFSVNSHDGIAGSWGPHRCWRRWWELSGGSEAAGGYRTVPGRNQRAWRRACLSFWWQWDFSERKHEHRNLGGSCSSNGNGSCGSRGSTWEKPDPESQCRKQWLIREGFTWGKNKISELTLSPRERNSATSKRNNGVRFSMDLSHVCIPPARSPMPTVTAALTAGCH